MTNTNSEILERVIEVVADPTLLSNFDLSQAGRRIRFTYEGVRYIVYATGHVTITKDGIEIGMTEAAADMKALLDIPSQYRRK